MSAFSTDVRILTCPQCGAPIELGRGGGQTQCAYCRAPLVVAARDDAPLQHGASPLSEPERIEGLRAQAASFENKRLPPEMLAVLAGGPLTRERVGPMLGVWRMYCQRASAGDVAAGDNAVLLTGALSGHFAAKVEDLPRQRALLESTLDALRAPSQKQVIRCSLARASARVGDLASAQTWFAACDPRSADLQADTAYRMTHATLATARGDFRSALAALGPSPIAVPIALPSRLHAGVLRANALEKLGDLTAAVAQLVAEARAHDGGRAATPEIVEASPHLHLCPQSLPLARMQW
ncbi:MAG: hypothetical protein KF764_13970 [Labilithrix sp.]|nr:hypothetical protein [Labilithrix sp.]